MQKIFVLILIIGFILHDVYCQTTFNATEYGRTHPCTWLPCNVTGFSIGNPSYTMTCCVLQLPLNYAQPNQTIPISMVRLNANQTVGNYSTVFMLSGGPGGSGWNLFSIAASLVTAAPGIHVILPDHRGTGLSSALSCNDSGSQVIDTACINYLLTKWGRDGLNQFSITNAAHDLSVQIQSYQATNTGRVGIFAVSYGTLWLDRFLQIYPTVVQAAVMDGVFDPLTSSDSRATLLTDQAAWQFLSYCQLQVKCNLYFPIKKPPAVMLLNILEQVDANQQRCIKENFAEYAITSDGLRNMFLDLITDSGRYYDRTIVPGLIFRLNRCNADDITVLKYFFKNTAKFTSADISVLLFSRVLAYHVVQSETWLAMNESEIDQDTFNAWRQSTIMSLSRPSNFFTLRSQWPKYPLDQYYGKYASQASVMMMSGTLDPSTVFHQASHIASVSKRTRIFYPIPLSGHVTASLVLAGFTCPIGLALSHLFPDIVPASFSDPICIEKMPTMIDFVADTDAGITASQKLLNTSLPFGSEPPIRYNSGHRVNNSLDGHILQIFLFFIITIIFQ